MPVHSLAHSPLSPTAVRELLAMPAMPAVPEEEFDEYSEKVLGWEYTCLVSDAVVTGHGHDALVELVGEWAALPGWVLLQQPDEGECEAVLDRTADVVAAELGPPLRTLRSNDWLGMGPYLRCRIWRMGEHGVVLAPREDGGPYGYLTHLVLAVHPWPAGEELPVADEDCLRWVRDRIIL
ncbi:hypothetical protein [Streptomyces sp. NPDC050392]|uniref:hypothetical protein n=1 Tax=Streptomyces sp. NPDC050392 TaxID=3155782 RepID=UPI0034467A26